MSGIVNQFFNNMFGAIAGSSVLGRVGAGKDFFEYNGKTIKLTGKGMPAQWLGLKTPIMQKYAYEFCFPVASVCDKLAEMDTNGVIEIKRSQGKGRDNLATNDWANKMNALLEQPNPLQSWAQFRGQQCVYKRVFGYCPVLPIIPAGYEKYPENATAMINIPPWLFEPVGTGKLLYQTKLEDIVKEYRVTILGSSFTLAPNQIFILEDSFMQDEARNFLVPKSRLCGLDMAVSNICAAMEADNIMLRRGGPLGLMSSKATDAMGSSLPMNDEQKAMAQEDLNGYGISWSQFQFMISRNPLDLQMIGFNAKQLGSKETVVAGEKAICHRYSFPYTLYEETEATYANGSNAALSVYQDNVVPNNQKDLTKYNKFFKAKENSCVITGCYDHLSVFQEDEAEKQAAANDQVSALQVEYDEDIITKNQWLEARGYEKVADGDKYKSEYTTADTTEATTAEPTTSTTTIAE
jgi:hypothetical protein